MEIDEQTGEAMSSAIDPIADPKNIEKDILRYYYYIHNGIDTEHVAPLENARILSVMSMLTERLRKNYPQHLIDLTEEVREDYMLSVKKAIVDFVLRDSKETDASESAANAKVPEYRAELDVVPRPWHASYVRARSEVAKNLHLINPCMAQLLKLWHVSFK
jgi:dynein heavy chain